MRRFLLGAILPLFWLTGHAFGQAPDAYPSRPVKLVVGVAAGGAPDIIARLLGQWLTTRMNQSFIVENKAGAGGNLAAEAVVRSPADGYTLFLAAPSAAINATLYPNLSFNLLRDFTPVGGVLKASEALVVHPDVPAKNLAELVAYAKANPGKLNMASAGNGSGPHLSGVLFMMMSGTSLTHVPYRSGAQALTDVMAGRVDLTFVTSGFAIEQIRAGSVRALGVTTDRRSEQLPEVAAIAEVLPGYESSTWYGVLAPRNTPDAIVAKLNAQINTSLADPDVKTRIAELDAFPIPGTPEDFGKLLAAETEKKAVVIRTSGIKLE